MQGLQVGLAANAGLKALSREHLQPGHQPQRLPGSPAREAHLGGAHR